MSRLLINVATYNERENLPALLAAIWEQRPDADVFVVDDNSPDGTGDWCRAEMEGEALARLFHSPAENGGWGRPRSKPSGTPSRVIMICY